MKKTAKKVEQILVINPGSTSTKYKVFDEKGNVLDEHNYKISEVKEEGDFLLNLENVIKIGIRVVHGGDISETSKITKKLKKKIADYIDFAPIHNTRAIETIEKMEKHFPKTALFACFDTAFHTTMPEHLSTYAMPVALAKKYKLKKYGFHGLAVQSGYEKFKKKRKEQGLKVPKNIIFAHLGGGDSITAVKNGKSFYTSMGLTPISGIMMA
ncbi:MAG: acetate kinase, partial [Candidatus Pacebacteria bacterium]|nr:acetate kinase [Candidatus Paceibacterota bacterium]